MAKPPKARVRATATDCAATTVTVVHEHHHEDQRVSDLLTLAADTAETQAAGFSALTDRMDGLAAQVERLLRMGRRELRHEEDQSMKLEDIVSHVATIESKVAEQATVQQGAVTLLGSLSAMVADTNTKLREALDNGSDEEIQAQLDKLAAVGAAMDEQRGALSAALVANTPASEEPAPPAEEPPVIVEPPAEEPAPAPEEPVAEEPAPVEPAPEPAPPAEEPPAQG